MRTLVELFKLIKANKKLLCTGLCGIVHQLFSNDLIDLNECNVLLEYIDNNRPTKESKYYNAVMAEARSAWYWPIGKWYPRLLWINAQLRELSVKKKQAK